MKLWVWRWSSREQYKSVEDCWSCGDRVLKVLREKSEIWVTLNIVPPFKTQMLGKEMSFRAHQVDGEHLIAEPIEGMRVLENLHCCLTLPSPPLLQQMMLFTELCFTVS